MYRKDIEYIDKLRSWVSRLEYHDFAQLWDMYRSAGGKAQSGWVQVELIKRFPEFIQWVNQLEDPRELLGRKLQDYEEDQGHTIHEPSPAWRTSDKKNATKLSEVEFERYIEEYDETIDGDLSSHL